MDDLAVGAVVRALRRRLGLRQVDLAVLAAVSQPVISRIERGRLDHLTLNTLRKVGRALELALPFDPRWRGGELPRLRDREHAAIVERCVRILRDLGWEVLVEYTFNRYGDRGSVDVVAWHPGARALVLIEVKSRLLDVQALMSGSQRKLRVVPRLLARERGWIAASVGNILLVSGTTANRSVVADHAATFATTFPHRAREARTWIRRPKGSLAAVWFISDSRQGTAPTRAGGPQRVRRASPSTTRVAATAR